MTVAHPVFPTCNPTIRTAVRNTTLRPCPRPALRLTPRAAPSPPPRRPSRIRGSEQLPSPVARAYIRNGARRTLPSAVGARGGRAPRWDGRNPGIGRASAGRRPARSEQSASGLLFDSGGLAREHLGARRTGNRNRGDESCQVSLCDHRHGFKLFGWDDDDLGRSLITAGAAKFVRIVNYESHELAPCQTVFGVSGYR